MTWLLITYEGLAARKEKDVLVVTSPVSRILGPTWAVVSLPLTLFATKVLSVACDPGQIAWSDPEFQEP